MKIEVVHVPRRLNWPVWAVLLVLMWFALGGAAVWLGTYLGRPFELCLFKRLTGLACPTCGFTRGVIHLMRAQVWQAWLCNPLLYSILALFLAGAVMRVFFAQRLRIQLTRAERAIAWIVAFAIFVCNWAYVILRVG